MLLDISFVIENIQLIAVSVLLVLIIKTLIAGGTGFLLGHTFQGTVILGLALSQVGEFSFVLAKLGFENNVISDFYYRLFLAVAVITMALTPFLFYLSRPLARTLLRLPLPDYLINGLFPLKEIDIPSFSNHLVIIGKDASAMKLSLMARHNSIGHISIVFDPALAREKMNTGDLVVYGDAVNEPILRKAHADTADIIVISVGSIVPSMAIIEKVRSINSKGYIIVRAPNIKNLEQLYKCGADEVLPEKFEIAVDLLSRILSRRQVPQQDTDDIIRQIRDIHLGEYSRNDYKNR
jgi:CPA2 family monovalent cation:H+ antiporter-2